MSVTRREWIGMAATLPAMAMVSRSGNAAMPAPPSLPDKATFQKTSGVYLDSGTSHPMSHGARAAIEAYLAKRSLDPTAAGHKLDSDGVRAKFARLINAEPDEIAFVQSTTTGEHMVLRALGLPARGAHIVTDTLHFFGSFPLYEEMAKLGCNVTWLRPRDGRIMLEDIERAVRKGTKLVALSLVSTFNGFTHDLKKVCEIAHAHGAMVYADIVHAAGCMPLDVKESGVDFAACASYKWLMGDFGLGFLYARKDRLDLLPRTQWGYYGLNRFTSHAYPLDPPGETVADYGFPSSAMGHFAFGTYAHTVVAQLHHSLDYILKLGPANIQSHAQTLTARLKDELPKRGYVLATPPESRAPIVTCILEDAVGKLRPRLAAADVQIMVSRNRFRVTPSVFNDMEDIERLLAALP